MLDDAVRELRDLRTDGSSFPTASPHEVEYADG